MTRTLILVLGLLMMTVTRPADAADPWVTYTGTEGPGVGKTIVLVSGDEEYRSEEALPQLARILAIHHGFTCRVVFAIDPETGVINPDIRDNIPGLEALADADLMIIATRFRDLPDAQMKHIDDYVRSGRPVIGIRTATHAFAIESSDTYKRYTWNNQDPEYMQGFGRQVLGETWVSHHGHHGKESTRGIPAPDAAGHAILRGIESGDIWGPTDVYTVRLPMPDDVTPIVLGEVVNGMKKNDPPVEGDKNNPMMPIAWTKTSDRPDHPRRVFTSTLGSARDFQAEGSRRMLINAAYWALGMEEQIPPDGTHVDLVGTYQPSPFSFGGSRRGVRPHDHQIAVPDEIDDGASLSLRPDDRIVVLGSTFAERMAQSGVFDAVAHATHPDHRLTIRHLPWSADEVGSRPRETKVPKIEDWVDRLDPNVIVMCYGMSESFTAGESLDDFRSDLVKMITDLRSRPDQHGRSPRLALVSPIAHQDLGAPWPTGEAITERNDRIAAVAGVMQDVAAEHRVLFVDLFGPSRSNTTARLTTNGIHPTEDGCGLLMGEMARQFGWSGLDGTATDAEQDAAQSLRELTCDNYYLFRLRYRPTNTEYVWGRRAAPFGIINFPEEMEQLDRMIAGRDEAIWAMTKPSAASVLAHAAVETTMWQQTPSHRRLTVDDWTPTPVEAKGTETSLGAETIAPPEEFVKSFTVANGYVIECFASEIDFPELANPLAMTFDDRGRLWVLCAPTYPHLMPGKRPECRLIILSDTDRDGRADDMTVFADELYVPTGFVIDVDTVYIGQAPDLFRLRDTDGDGRADTREIVASGFGMCDSHHTISAFEWDPSGGFLMHEGVFTRTSVETPYETHRTRDAAVWRYDPRTERLHVLSHCSFSNPWGHVFDGFGASILADASGGANFSFSHVSLPYEFPHKPNRGATMLNRGRPTAGCEIIAGRHFPEEVHGSFVINQSIGFHGTRWDQLTWDGSWWSTQSMPLDLITCTDVNFRPVGVELGPDGALYVLDWANRIVGHMQYSVRDPRRDHSHGRVWRVRHESNPLVESTEIADASAGVLLSLLKIEEPNTRQLVRRRLQRMPWSTVRDALTTWQAMLDPTDPVYDRLILEDLWIRHAHGQANADILERAIRLREPQARAGAVRVVRQMIRDQTIDLPDAIALLDQTIEDVDMRVRFESLITSGLLPARDGVAIAARAELHDMDDPMHHAFGEVLSFLSRDGSVDAEVVERVKLARMPAAELLAQPINDVNASVRLARPELTLEQRRAALVHLVGEDHGPQAERLIQALRDARGDGPQEAVAEMILGLPDAALAPIVPALNTMIESPDRVRRAVALAARVRQGIMLDVSTQPIGAVDALSVMTPGQAPDDMIDALMESVESGRVDPIHAVEQISRHHPDDDTLTNWLTGLADDAGQTGLDRWDNSHLRGMAALQALNNGNAEIEARYHVAAGDAETMARGRTLYLDEERGCARCHGVRGQGLEGFPALARSPWVLGDPRRSAAIAVHGLFGQLRMPNGESFNSAMAPLGENLGDQELADILTYIRQSWGNFATPVTATQVADARATRPSSGVMWQVATLEEAFPMATDRLVVLPATQEDTVDTPGGTSIGTWLLYIVPPIAAVVLVIVLLGRSDRTAA